jgi:hypothetical protein
MASRHSRRGRKSGAQSPSPPRKASQSPPKRGSSSQSPPQRGSPSRDITATLTPPPTAEAMSGARRSPERLGRPIEPHVIIPDATERPNTATRIIIKRAEERHARKYVGDGAAVDGGGNLPMIRSGGASDSRRATGSSRTSESRSTSDDFSFDINGAKTTTLLQTQYHSSMSLTSSSSSSTSSSFEDAPKAASGSAVAPHLVNKEAMRDVREVNLSAVSARAEARRRRALERLDKRLGALFQSIMDVTEMWHGKRIDAVSFSDLVQLVMRGTRSSFEISTYAVCPGLLCAAARPPLTVEQPRSRLFFFFFF